MQDKPLEIILSNKEPLQVQLNTGTPANTAWNTIQATLTNLAIYATFIGLFLMPSCMNKMQSPHGRVARIPLNGTIQRGGSANADKIVRYLDTVKTDGSTAVWMVINSPGGYVYPSKEIADKILDVRAGKDGILGTADDIPVVMQIKDIGASGAYWIAATGERIFADEASLVGSIGVRMDYFEFSELLKKVGVKSVEIHKGKYKTMGSPYRELTDEERKLLEQHMDVAYKMFIGHVAKNRKMKYDEVEKLATGWIFYGSEAKERKLIDEIGGDKAVEDYLKKKVNTEKLYYVDYQEQPGFFDGLASKMGESIGRGLTETINEDIKDKVIKEELK